MQENYSENNNFTIQQNENNEAKQRLNNEYLKLNGSANTEDTVGFFTKHNRVFQVLAILFSAVGVYFDLLTLTGVAPALLVGLSIGLFLEFGKDRLSRGLFNTSLDDVSRFGLVGGTLFIIMLIALLLHIRSINNFVGLNFEKQTNSIYQDELKLSKANTAINLELAKALNNGTSKDDIISARAIKSNNKTLQTTRNSKAKNFLLDSLKDSKNTLKGILYLLFISIEFFSLFGIFGMLIIQRNTDGNLKQVITTADKLANMEANVYQAVETNMINNYFSRIQNLQKEIAPYPTLGDREENKTTEQAPYPTIGYTAGEKGEIWSNVSSAYPALPTNIAKSHNVDGSNIFLKGTTDACQENGFKVEKYPLVPKKHKKTRIVKKLGEFKILDDVCRDREDETEFESEKVSKFEFDEEFISREEWDEMSEESRALAMSYVDLSLYDAINEVPMIQIMYENGLINKYDEPLLKKVEAVKAFKNLKGGSLQDARDIYVRVAEKLEKQDKIVRRSRYHNRCLGLNIGKVTVG